MKSLHILAVSLPFSFVCACATSRSPQAANAGPTTSQNPTPSVSSAFSPVAQESDGRNGPVGAGAPMYLERALDALRDGQPGYASAALHSALSTGELNDAGRALAYWYIYVADTMQGQAQSSHDALADFVAIADSVLATREQIRFAESGGTDFVDRFDLIGRLARGRALLNLAWAEGHATFGRSADVPVPVRSEEEIAYFVELTPACSHPLERKTSQIKPVTGYNASLRKVDFHCGNQVSDTVFFFEWRGPSVAVPIVASNARSVPTIPRKMLSIPKGRKQTDKSSTAR